MLKRKCPSCAKKIEKKFSFCPYCGMSFKKQGEEDSFGMIGRDDFIGGDFKNNEELGLPFGLDKMMNSLMKQLGEQMRELNGREEQGVPKGFKIQISTGKPQMKKVNPMKEEVHQVPLRVSGEELERRRKLPIKEVESNVRRLADRIVYEFKVPGVKSKKDIIITKLENSIEIKAYSKDKCYYKAIPLKVEIIGYYLQDEKLFLEFRD